MVGDAVVPAVYLFPIDPDGLRQVNAMLPSGLRPGTVSLQLQYWGVSSEPVEVALV